VGDRMLNLFQHPYALLGKNGNGIGYAS
jgi:hypothetical protein